MVTYLHIEFESRYLLVEKQVSIGKKLDNSTAIMRKTLLETSGHIDVDGKLRRLGANVKRKTVTRKPVGL